MLIERILNKLPIIQKLPRRVAKPIFVMIIFFDELFWKLRIFIFILVFGKDNKIGKALSDLKKTGVAVIPKFYSDNEVLKIKKECIKQLDELPFEKLDTNEYIENLLVKFNGNDLRLERLGKSIKLKGLHYINSFFRKIGSDFKTSLINLIYHLDFSKPFLIYNITHDGSFVHPAFSKSFKSEIDMIAGKPHVDRSIHQLRFLLALDDVKEENGPTVCYKKSMHLNEIKKNHLNLLLEKFNFEVDGGGSHFVNEEKLKFLEKKANKIHATVNRGDLMLLDLKTVHYASPLKSGERHILWYYY